MNKNILYLIIFILGSISLAGQEVDFRIEAPEVVSAGERFQISYVLNAKPDQVNFPPVRGLQKIGGPYESTSSNTQYINGRWSHSIEKTYTYMYYADKEGTYTVPQATVVIGGKQYSAGPLKIQVVKGKNTRRQRQQSSSNYQSRQPSRSQPGQRQSASLKDNIFIRTVISKSKVFLGEQFILTYKLYFASDVTSVDHQELRTFEGFWAKDLTSKQSNFKQYEEEYNGRMYSVAELGKFALFPQKTGKIKIPAKKVPLTVRIRESINPGAGFGSIFDQFFNSYQYKEVDATVYAPAVTINVKPLPEKGKPASFTGAVGNFTMKTEIDKLEAKTNDAITLKVTIKGRGNIELFDGPKLDFPPDFEVYDPKVEQHIVTSDYGVSGTKSFEYLIIPRSAGEYEIPESEFSFFNPNKKRYITLKTPSYKLTITKSASASNISSYQSSASQHKIKDLNTDIYHIRTKVPELKKESRYIWGSVWFYFFLFFPVAAFILFTVWMKNELKKRGNRSLIRTKKATKVARNRLKKAKELLKKNKKQEFYMEVSEALWGYLSDKFGIPLSQLSMSTIEEKLAEHNVSEDLISRFIDLLNQCEFSRYAPAESNKDMNFIYNEAIALISDMERELK